MSPNNMLESLHVLGYDKRIAERKTLAAEASDNFNEMPNVNLLATQLHPKNQKLIIDAVITENSLSKTFRFKSAENKPLAYFNAGQYLPLRVTIDGNEVIRPYSISSSPKNSTEGFYEITIRRNDNGFVSKYALDHWKEGMIINCAGADGFFYHSPIRDSKNIIGIAGGSGITPFRSMAKALLDGDLEVDSYTLFYGCNVMSDVLFYDEFKAIETKTNGKFKLVTCLANETAGGCEKGFIDGKLIEKYSNIHASTLFICGPQGLYNHIKKELEPYNLRRKFVRFELFGEQKNIASEEDYPNTAVGKTFNLTVKTNGQTHTTTAQSEESLLVALEKAGLKPPSRCRSGSCGFCRSYLISGDVYVSSQDDGRRLKDKELGFIHPCSSFALSDLEIIVPITI